MNPEQFKGNTRNDKCGAAEEINALTPREKEVGCLLADGLTSTEIAAYLSLSEHTVHEHIRHMYERLDCHHRGQLIACILRSGICTQADK